MEKEKNELNSNNNHKEQRREKVVTGNVTEKKKSELQKFGDAFIAEDAKNVKSYLITDVVLPALKDLLVDFFTKGIRMAVYGDGGRGGRDDGIRASRVSYSSISSPRSQNARRDRNPVRDSNMANYNQVYFDNRGDAEEVLDTMRDCIDQYQFVTVAAFYDFAGIESKHTDENYGWTNLASAKVIRARDGYKIDFPRAIPID